MDGGMRVVWSSLIAGALILGSVFCLNCKTNRAPGQPSAPDGPTSGVNDSLYSFTTTATDPDGGEVCYRFDWGDSDTSEWTSWVQSGQPGAASHAWNASGAFTVRAQAKDTGELLSAWSAAHKLNVAFSWTRALGGPKPDYGSSVQQTTDGGYIIVGYTSSYGAGDYDVWLVKIDAAGNKAWDRTFGGIGGDVGTSVRQTTDGGYIVTGHTASYGAGYMDAWLIKTDSSGNETWDKTFGGPSSDYGSSVQQTTDGGYIIVGHTASYGAGGDDVWLVKTDASGNKVWDKTFGGTGADHGASVQQTSDGGYIIAGFTKSYGVGGYDVWLVKTDAAGIDVWDRTWGGTADDYGASVQQTFDGGYIVTGTNNSYRAGVADVFLIKTDAVGNTAWEKTFGGSNLDFSNSVQQTTDGEYIITGSTSSYGAGADDIWLLKIDASGNKAWDRTFGGTGTEVGHSVKQTCDGGYIVAGYTDSYGAGRDDVWLIKTDANGE
jgi:hypothetical protein